MTNLANAVQRGEAAASALKSGEFITAVNEFNDALAMIYSDRRRLLWLDSFSSIAKSFLNLDVPERSDNQDDCRQKVQKILVGGTGWSGSGALFDYFREFSEVGAIDHEFQHIEGEDGFVKTFFEGGNAVVDPERVLRFYLVCLLGLVSPSDFPTKKMVVSARTFCLQGENSLYAEASSDLIYSLIKQIGKDLESVRRNSRVAFQEFMDSIVYSLIGPGKIGLLDNVIHCERVSYLSFLADFNYFAVFRDPRSQYCALHDENPRFHKNVDRFIQEYRCRRKRYHEGKESLVTSHPSRRIHTVSFERFVLSESYRREISDTVGLSRDGQKEREYFDPAISMKNVFLHEKHDNQSAVQAIERALPEYCVDVRLTTAPD